jgi:hypothetical protein
LPTASTVASRRDIPMAKLVTMPAVSSNPSREIAPAAPRMILACLARPIEFDLQSIVSLGQLLASAGGDACGAIGQFGRIEHDRLQLLQLADGCRGRHCVQGRLGGLGCVAASFLVHVAKSPAGEEPRMGLPLAAPAGTRRPPSRPARMWPSEARQDR